MGYCFERPLTPTFPQTGRGGSNNNTAPHLERTQGQGVHKTLLAPHLGERIQVRGCGVSTVIPMGVLAAHAVFVLLLYRVRRGVKERSWRTGDWVLTTGSIVLYVRKQCPHYSDGP
ncbi:hypothetical protein MELA_02071 [Candidatus Methylomirabilis lanthanidiphila]|uniref:Uncharacterized protein n=1 Tax=Candidatus Methylomirabilis lanthanidiphila TaxID=2211376 RepID=A0A564ZKN9_9BACT|nr:hypothetical protein MELA_02071 [Candidatus Methylomirabilis lanthanidiphila]